jgi:hypothetical protein
MMSANTTPTPIGATEFALNLYDRAAVRWYYRLERTPAVYSYRTETGELLGRFHDPEDRATARANTAEWAARLERDHLRGPADMPRL